VTLEELLKVGPRPVNVGIRDFAESLRSQGVPVVEVVWTPPPALKPEVADLLEKLL